MISVIGLGLSASYTVLLTWLLSMVPENYDFLIKKPEELEQVPFYPPFYVLGMQQLLMDEDLCLVVAVTPHPLCDTKGIPNKQKKSKTKVQNLFPAKLKLQNCKIVTLEDFFYEKVKYNCF